MAQIVKSLPPKQETPVQSLGQEEPLENGVQTTLVFFPGESYGQRSPAGYSPWGCRELDMTERLTHTHTGDPWWGLHLVTYILVSSQIFWI